MYRDEKIVTPYTHEGAECQGVCSRETHESSQRCPVVTQRNYTLFHPYPRRLLAVPTTSCHPLKKKTTTTTTTDFTHTHTHTPGGPDYGDPLRYCLPNGKRVNRVKQKRYLLITNVNATHGRDEGERGHFRFFR